MSDKEKKQRLKEEISKKVNEIIDAIDIAASLDYFDISIKNSGGEKNYNFTCKYKDRAK